MAEILWDVDTRDSEGADYAGIAANIRREVGRSIVLMHENRGQTIRALDHGPANTPPQAPDSGHRP